MSKKLKIAVFHNLPAGGALRALHDNINIFKLNGHQVDVYTTDMANYSFISLDDVCDNYYVFKLKRSKFREFAFKLIEKFTAFKFNPNSRAAISYKDFKSTQKEIADEINSKNYDFVFMEQDFLFSMTPIIPKYIKALTIYYCNQPSRNSEYIFNNLNPSNAPFYLKIYRKFFGDKYFNLDTQHAQYVDYILCNSYFTHENILKIYGLNSQVSYLGIDTNEFSALELPRKNVVLSVGAIIITKGYEFIIKSIANVDESIRPKFLIIGYKSDKKWAEYLIALANQLNVELEIRSGISYDELIRIYNEVKIVIFAPYLEPFGLVPLEAFTCGTPVIGVKEGGVKETVKHGVTGLLLDRDEQIFAEGITELLINQELWDKFSNNGPKYIEDFWTLDCAGERLLNNVYNILDKSKK